MYDAVMEVTFSRGTKQYSCSRSALGLLVEKAVLVIRLPTRELLGDV